MSVPYLLTNTSVVLIINGVPHEADASHPKYEQILAAIQAENWDMLPNLINLTNAINAFGEGKIVVQNGVVYYNNAPVHNSLTQRILEMVEQGFNVSPMVQFMENLMNNPSAAAVNELYGFLEVCKLPITEDGHFIAYKRVREDYKSFHDCDTDNSIGTILSMPRNRVDDNRNQTCSHGLHFCSRAYIDQFNAGSGRIVLLKINPRDVVSIPADYNNTKGRACCYEVIGEVDAPNKDLPTDVFTTAVVSSTAAHNDRDYMLGYVAGYSSGRLKETADMDAMQEAWNDTTDDSTSFDSFAEGFDRGYIDGRGHKRRLYTKADINF